MHSWTQRCRRDAAQSHRSNTNTDNKTHATPCTSTMWCDGDKADGKADDTRRTPPQQATTGAAVRRPPPMRTPHHGHTSPHVRTTRHTTCATTRCTTPRRSEPTSHADTHRMRVLTFSHSISYMPRTADLIWRLLASLSTMNTRVLLSSIFFIADSVVSG